MSMFRRICVGTDFSPEAERGLTSAVHLARMFAAELLLVHVVEAPRFYQRVLAPVQTRLRSLDETCDLAAERCRALIAASQVDGVSADYRVRVGTPFVDLIDAARIAHADLIVLGHRARSGTERFFLGSTAERVLRKSTIPVLIAKNTCTDSPTSLLAPTDLSEGSEPAMAVATALAERWNARLTFLHVIEPVTHAEVWPLDASKVELYLAEPGELEPEWQTTLADIPLSKVNVDRQTVQGSAVAEIVRIADELGAGLIVMGTHGRSGVVHALLGSVAEQVAREARCSVLSVRPREFVFALP